MVRVVMAPDVEVRMEIDLAGIDRHSRDHDVQKHKEKVHAAFLERMKKAFPEGDVRIDRFSFGLEKKPADEAAA